jgi:hypothetical protein
MNGVGHLGGSEKIAKNEPTFLAIANEIVGGNIPGMSAGRRSGQGHAISVAEEERSGDYSQTVV